MQVRRLKAEGTEVDFCLIGAKATAFFKRFGGSVLATATHLGDQPRVEDLIGTVKIMLDESREIAASPNLIVVAHGRFAGGGMMLAPNAVMDDGLLDVVVADRVSRLEIIRELPRIGRGGHLKNPLVGEYRARSISVAAEGSLGLEIDGESAGKTPARLCILPASVRFLVKASQDR